MNVSLRAWLGALFLALLLLSAHTASAATINVDSGCTLAQAITSANTNATPTGSTCEAGSATNLGEDEIALAANVTLSAALPQITSYIKILGKGFTINGGGSHRIFHVNHSDARLTVESVTLTNGFTAGKGGAIYIQAGGATVNYSALTNNRAQRGGALAADAGHLWGISSTFYNNTATANGGALWFGSGGSLNPSFYTIVGNTAPASAGGGIYYDGGITEGLSLFTSIVAGNTGGDCVRVSGTTYAGGVNLVQDGSCSLSNALSGDPKLHGFRDGHLPMMSDSPARGAETSLCVDYASQPDQRNVARQSGSCDIGAVQYYAAQPIATPTPVAAPVVEIPATGGQVIGSPGIGGQAFPGEVGQSPSGSEGAGGAPPAPPTASPTPFCTGMLLNQRTNLAIWARYGLCSGAQFQRVGRDGIGIQSVLDQGFLDAVDVWSYVEQGVEVCFPQHGRIILLDASTSPRSQVNAPYYQKNGMTCASINKPGTLVLLAGPPAPTVYQPLQSCMVTTQGMIRFRDAPGGAPLRYTDPWGRQENGRLPGSVTLTALERTGDWFKVDYHGTQGWVSAHHVTPHGACG